VERGGGRLRESRQFFRLEIPRARDAVLAPGLGGIDDRERGQGCVAAIGHRFHAQILERLLSGEESEGQHGGRLVQRLVAVAALG